MKKTVACLMILILMSGGLFLSGCSASKTAKGAGIGAATGAVVGGVIGHQSGHKTGGAVIGAAAGAGIGALIGRRLDKQAQELEQVPGVESVSVDQEQQKIEAVLKINFDVDKDVIKPTEAVKLDDLANVFSKYPENIVLLEGHTDADGPDDYNQLLSERRARSVENYMRTKNLNIVSLTSVGYGESRPLADNDTPAGKEVNRRVEIKISVDPNRVPQE
jgi:outer membrane protein OmpA-like peptidoglycan-associated protein